MKNKMKKVTAIVLLAACLFLTVAMCACSKKQNLERCSTYSFDYFDTVSTVIGYEKNHSEFDVWGKQIREKLERYHKLYDIYNEYTDEGIVNLCTVNKNAGSGEALKVDREIIDLLLYAKEIYILTGSRVNVAMGSVLSVWHRYREEAGRYPYVSAIPTEEELNEAAKHTNIDNVVIDKANMTVMLTDSKMSLDVGAIAKGYATEMIARWLENEGVKGYILNIGGNVRTIGKRGDGEKWLVGIENPKNDGSNEYAETVALAGQSLVTSGDYQRFYTHEGKNYHHIIDPDTMLPSEYFASVSVISKDSALGDALSTALFCMSYEEGSALIGGMKDVEAMWIAKDGKITFSAGFEKYCSKDHKH